MANAAYSYDDEKKELFSYDNPASLAMKSNFIQSQQLGGAAFWEASGDRQDEEGLTTLVSIGHTNVNPDLLITLYRWLVP